MTLMQISKRLAGILLALGFVAVVAGCRSSRSDSHASIYSEPAVGGTGSSTYSESGRSGQWETSGTSSTTTTESKSEPTQGQQEQGKQIIPLYEEQLVVGTRTTESDGVRLRKDVTTETVSQPVQVRRETLMIDRQASSGGQAASGQTSTQTGALGTPFEKGELVIRLHNEEPVVEKRVVPSGQIVVQRKANTEQMNVQREVRREKINVEKMGDGQNVIVSEKVGAQSNEAAGSAPAEQQQIKGTQSSEQQSIEPYRAPVTTEEGQPFPRPQPDGRETFPNLNKNPERK